MSTNKKDIQENINALRKQTDVLKEKVISIVIESGRFFDQSVRLRWDMEQAAIDRVLNPLNFIDNINAEDFKKMMNNLKRDLERATQEKNSGMILICVKKLAELQQVALLKFDAPKVSGRSVSTAKRKEMEGAIVEVTDLLKHSDKFPREIRQQVSETYTMLNSTIQNIFQISQKSGTQEKVRPSQVPSESNKSPGSSSKAKSVQQAEDEPIVVEDEGYLPLTAKRPSSTFQSANDINFKSAQDILSRNIRNIYHQSETYHKGDGLKAKMALIAHHHHIYKTTKRDLQIKFLEKYIADIKKSKSLIGGVNQEKALLGLLLVIQDQVDNEKNFFNSRLKHMVDKMLATPDIAKERKKTSDSKAVEYFKREIFDKNPTEDTENKVCNRTAIEHCIENLKKNKVDPRQNGHHRH